MGEVHTGTPEDPYFSEEGGGDPRLAARDLIEFGYPDFVQEQAARAVETGYAREDTSADGTAGGPIADGGVY